MADILKAADIDGDVPEPFWHGLFAGRSVNAIAGPSGVGKSTITVKVAADMSHHFPVIYCNFEDDKVVQRMRLEAAGADLDKVFLSTYDVVHDLETIRYDMQSLGSKLIILDTAEKAISAPMQRWGRPLDLLLHEVLEPLEAAAIFVHHTIRTLKQGASWHAAIGGSTQGLAGTSRGVLLCGVRPDDGSQVLVCPVKNSYGETGKAVAFDRDVESLTQANGDEVDVPYMVLAETGIMVADPVSLVRVAGDKNGRRGPSPERAAEAADFLRDNLADGPLPVNTCERCTRCLAHFSTKHVEGNGGACPDCSGPTLSIDGLKQRAENDAVNFHTIKRAKAALAIESGRKGAKEKSVPFWRLPDGHPALNAGAPTELL